MSHRYPTRYSMKNTVNAINNTCPSASCSCEDCWYDFYSENNKYHHSVDENGKDLCFGAKCKWCPYRYAGDSDEEIPSDDEFLPLSEDVEPSGWEDEENETDSEYSDSDRSDVSDEEDEIESDSESEVSDSGSDRSESEADSDSDRSDVSDVSDDYSDQSDESDEEVSDSDSERSDESESDEDDEEPAVVAARYDNWEEMTKELTGELMNMYGAIYRVHYKVQSMMRKAWSRKRERKITLLMAMSLPDGWIKDLKNYERKYSNYFTDIHYQMAKEIRALRKDLLVDWNDLWEMYW